MYELTIKSDLINSKELTDREFRVYLAMLHLADEGIYRETNYYLAIFTNRHIKNLEPIVRSLKEKGYIKIVKPRVYVFPKEDVPFLEERLIEEFG